MTIICPKCKSGYLKTGERKPVSQSTLYPNRNIDGEFVLSNNKKVYIRMANCSCGFDGYTIEVDIINLISFHEKNKNKAV